MTICHECGHDDGYIPSPEDTAKAASALSLYRQLRNAKRLSEPFEQAWQRITGKPADDRARVIYDEIRAK